MEDLERYLDEIVEPAVQDFANNPLSTRHAFLACVAVYHSIDWLAQPRKPSNMRKEFGIECPEFLMVDRVAHAFKHFKSDGRENEKVYASDVISRPPAFWGVAVWGLSRWGDLEGGVTLDQDRNIDLLRAIRIAVDYLRQKTIQG